MHSAAGWCRARPSLSRAGRSLHRILGNVVPLRSTAFVVTSFLHGRVFTFLIDTRDPSSPGRPHQLAFRSRPAADVAGLVDFFRGLLHCRHHILDNVAVHHSDAFDVVSSLHESDFIFLGHLVFSVKIRSSVPARCSACFTATLPAATMAQPRLRAILLPSADGQALRASRPSLRGADARAARLASSGDEPVKRATGRPPLCAHLWSRATGGTP